MNKNQGKGVGGFENSSFFAKNIKNHHFMPKFEKSSFFAKI